VKDSVESGTPVLKYGSLTVFVKSLSNNTKCYTCKHFRVWSHSIDSKWLLCYYVRHHLPRSWLHGMWRGVRASILVPWRRFSTMWRKRRLEFSTCHLSAGW